MEQSSTTMRTSATLARANIVLVQQKLGHRSIENTMVYTQLMNFESDEYNTSTATTTKEAEGLVQSGFEYVCTTTENIMLFRKRK